VIVLILKNATVLECKRKVSIVDEQYCCGGRRWPVTRQAFQTIDIFYHAFHLLTNSLFCTHVTLLLVVIYIYIVYILSVHGGCLQFFPHK
jgi:hypothetical protein